ncbi:MAG TPA: hypothetical protein VL728_00975 [Cyclobacteriaceae bacterium]|nr:hypothetical protein [Cyclobacteriaceae bacterium]
MEKIINEGFGYVIVERDSKLFIQYDNGQSASWTVENEISLEEAKKAMQNEQSAYHVILEAQRRGDTKRVR